MVHRSAIHTIFVLLDAFGQEVLEEISLTNHLRQQRDEVVVQADECVVFKLLIVNVPLFISLGLNELAH